jgi:uncharacterized membrane protein YdfJ with MMPL/SSD domain
MNRTMAAGASVIAKAATREMASAGLTVSTLSTAVLTGLVLGAGTDYALLLIHRYRHGEQVVQDERGALRGREPAEGGRPARPSGRSRTVENPDWRAVRSWPGRSGVRRWGG